MGVPAAQGQRRAREERQEAPNWGVLPPELLRDVLARVEGGDAQWPSRRNVVAAAGVCRAWRDISWCGEGAAIRDAGRGAAAAGQERLTATRVCRDLAAASSSEAACSPLTFPQHLRQAGPRDKCIECFIRRSRKTGIYTLYLGLPPTPTENGKFLMAARKCGWRPSCTEYIISLDPHTYSRTSSAYLGRLRANFLSTKFTIFDSSHPVAQPSGASSVPAAASNNSPSWGAGCVSPPRGSQPAAPVVSVAYALNVLGTRGPRRIQCTLHGVASEEDSVEGMAIHTGCAEEAAEHLEGGAVPVASGSAAVASRSRGAVADCSASVGDCGCVVCNGCVPSEPLVLKNKPPRWHEQLQCWCLNFRGRVTVASVKNFQLVECGGASDADKPVLLQFGKIGKDTFTMDYRYPLSAFQAFAICLSSFDTKVACE